MAYLAKPDDVQHLCCGKGQGLASRRRLTRL